MARTESLGKRNVVVFLVSSQIRVLRLPTYDALAVRVAQNATMVALAHTTQRFTTELGAQVLVSFATFLDFVESHGLPLRTIIASISGLRVLAALTRFNDNKFVDGLPTMVWTFSGMRCFADR